MKLRMKTLWRVPVYCILSGVVSYYLTVYVGGFFFRSEDSIDPLRSAVFSGVLFLLILLAGGLWFFRSMTKAEIAVSAGIASAIFLIICLAQLYLPGFPITLSFRLAIIQNWISTIASLFHKLTNRFTLSVILSNFTPLLYIPFGRKPQRRRRKRPEIKFQ